MKNQILRENFEFFHWNNWKILEKSIGYWISNLKVLILFPILLLKMYWISNTNTFSKYWIPNTYSILIPCIWIKVSKYYYAAIEVCFIVGKNRKYTTGIKLIESLHKNREQISCPMSISGDFVKFFRNSVKLTNFK